MMKAVSALTVEGICAGYGGGDIISDVTFQVVPGEVFVVIGPNGSGKSTLIKTLVGLVKSRVGTISLSMNPVSALNTPQRVAAGLAFVPQEFNVFPNMTVGENLQVSNEFLARSARATPHQRDKVLEMFPEVAGRLKFKAGLLSGGQRQMLAFACAMLANPKVLMLDEPSAGLSPKFVTEIFDKIKVVNGGGLTVFMIEQNVSEALRIADRVMVLVGGRVRLVTTPSDIGTKHDLHKLYLG